MIKLNYTDKMKEQDNLWRSESENLSTMKELYEAIYSEALKEGFVGYVNIYSSGDEMLAGVYRSMREYEDDCNGSFYMSDGDVGNCKALINRIEAIMNKEVTQND